MCHQGGQLGIFQFLLFAYAPQSRVHDIPANNNRVATGLHWRDCYRNRALDARYTSKRRLIHVHIFSSLSAVLRTRRKAASCARVNDLGSYRTKACAVIGRLPRYRGRCAKCYQPARISFQLLVEPAKSHQGRPSTRASAVWVKPRDLLLHGWSAAVSHPPYRSVLPCRRGIGTLAAEAWSLRDRLFWIRLPPCRRRIQRRRESTIWRR